VPAAAAAKTALVERKALERTNILSHEADHFENRDSASQGYKANFLGAGSLAVPMPRLPAALSDDLAPVEGNGIELTYTHFSVIFSKSRKLPVATATNIDGAQSQKLPRTDRDYEAADRWFYDLRIPRQFQLGPDVYDKTDFDYGHQVRREDPVWGDHNTARMANDDTFHMTNCAPQHGKLNRQSWVQLENAVLAAAKDNRLRISVFTGPVLSPQDPTVLNVQVPTAYWKIIAYNDHGALRAHGFMEDQSDLVDLIRSQLEALPQLDAVAQYQVKIAEIARVTSLDFGPLIDADELAAVSDDAAPPRRRVDESLIRSLVRQLPKGPAEVTPAVKPSRPLAAATRLDIGNGGGGINDDLLRTILQELKKMNGRLNALESASQNVP
jgi:endonuclease G